MNKYLVIIYLALTAGLHLNAQEAVTMPGINPALYYKNQKAADHWLEGSRDNYNVDGNVVYTTSPLSLPFVDDFSRNTLREFKQSSSAIYDSALCVGTCLTSNDVNTYPLAVRLIPGFIFSFDTILKRIDSIPNATSYPMRQFTYGGDCFSAFTNVTYYPSYFRYVNYIDSTNHLDSVLVFDSVMQVQYLYFSLISDSVKWMDNFAWVNNTLPLSPPSIGVATLDGLNQYGLPYDKRSPSRYGIADYLTSKPIDLSGLGNSDSVYLSFFYEPQGLGDWPNYQDSLVLEIRDKNDHQWYRIWSDTGFTSSTLVPNSTFKQAMVYIRRTTSALDPDPFYSGFQFRFKNYASLAGNNDHWHIDYVRLDKNRNMMDTSVPDIALVYPLPSILKYFTLMPWDQYRGNADLIDETIVTIANNNPVTTPSVDWSVTSKELTSSSSVYSSSTLSFPSDPIVTRSFNPATSFTSPVLSDDYRVIKTDFETNPSSNNLLTSNDTVSQYQVFDNLLAYDDGSAERAYGIEGLGTKKFAYEFKLDKPDTLSGIRVMFTNIDVDVSNLIFTLYVWDSISLFGGVGGKDSVIAELSSAKPHYVDSINGWTTYLLEQPVIVHNRFFLGWGQTDNRNLQIGLDLNSTRGRHHMFVYFSSLWDSSSLILDGSPMIRAILDGHYNGTSTAVRNIENKTLTVQLYPNPSRDQLYFITDEMSSLEYKLIDATGRNVKEGVLNGRNLDISHLENGFYCIQLSHATGNQTLKFIKY